jgi:hypothetical protein
MQWEFEVRPTEIVVHYVESQLAVKFEQFLTREGV